MILRENSWGQAHLTQPTWRSVENTNAGEENLGSIVLYRALIIYLEGALAATPNPLPLRRVQHLRNSSHH